MFTYKYLSTCIRLYVHLYEFLCMIYTSDNKSVLNTITFYLEDDNNEKFDFNGETLTFTLQTIKI